MMKFSHSNGGLLERMATWLLLFLLATKIQAYTSSEKTKVNSNKPLSFAFYPTSTHLPNSIINPATKLQQTQRCQSALPSKFSISSKQSHSHSDTKLYAEKTSKPKGVYTRPSAAIERGSGFYVPGLEGSRVRGLFGILILIFTVVNVNYTGVGGLSSTIVLPTMDAAKVGSAQATSEIISIFYGILLIIQGLVEFGKESGFVVNLNQDSTFEMDEGDVSVDQTQQQQQQQIGDKKKTVNQFASPELLSSTSLDIINNLQWTAASFVSLTPATHVMIVQMSSNEDSKESKPSILYTLGEFTNCDFENLTATNSNAVTSVIQTVFDSKGGRVSIPSDHPGAVLVPEVNRRCVLLQKVDNTKDKNKKYCLVVGSNQLLAAFTKNDLKWLGRLATYIEISLRD